MSKDVYGPRVTVEGGTVEGRSRESVFFFGGAVRLPDGEPGQCTGPHRRPSLADDSRHRTRGPGWAGYGYCAAHSRFFWGLRLFLMCTSTGCRSRGRWRT